MGHVREDGEMVIKLDAKRLLVLGVIAAITVFSLYGYITAIFAFIAPTQDFPLEVTVATFGTTNNPQSSFGRGTTVRISATVEKATGYYYFYPDYYDFVGDTSYRIIFAVMDGGRSPVFFQSTTTMISISPGAIQVTSNDYAIPSGATTGTYTIRVVVWSDWLPSGVALAPLAGVQIFEVT